MMKNDEDTLLSKLIEETCTESLEKDQPNSFLDLRNYFEKRSNEVDYISIADYLNQQHLTHQQISYQNNSGCYRLYFKQAVLDFPSNWSIFKEIKSADLIYVDQSLDQDSLLDIFSELNGNFQNIALIKEDRDIQLVFLSEESAHDHVTWMRAYYEKKKAGTIEKAAA